jgi:ABC-type thiamine transport system ATPase subunit
VDPELRAYLDQRFGAIDQRFDGIDQRFDGVDQRLAGNDRQFSAIDQRFDGIDRRFVELDAALRRHFGVLIEQIRHELQLVAEMVVGNTEAIAVIRVRLDAR